MSSLNTYRFYFKDDSYLDVDAATESGAQSIFTRRHEMGKLLNLKYIARVGGVANE